MRHWLAAWLALWAAALSSAPLAAAILQPDGPKMACCKRSLKNCCCRKAHGSGPAIVALTSCSDSCQQQSFNVPAQLAFAPAAVSSVDYPKETRLLRRSVVTAKFELYRSDLFQRPPPSFS
jgi:hypothetical protein